MPSPRQIFAIVYQEDLNGQPIRRAQVIESSSLSRNNGNSRTANNHAYDRVRLLTRVDPDADPAVPMESVGVFYDERRLLTEVSFTTIVASDDPEDDLTRCRTFKGQRDSIGTIEESEDGILRCMVDGHEWRRMLDGWKTVTQCLREVLSNSASKLHSSTTTGNGESQLGRSIQPAELLHELSTAADAADRLERDFSEFRRCLEGLIIISGTTTTTRPKTNTTTTPGPGRVSEETVPEDLTEETTISIKNIENFIALDLVKKVESLFQRASNILSIDEASRAREQNASMKRMSWITFIFLPLLFVVSIYGMNIDSLENNPKWYTTLYFAIPLFVVVISSFHIIKHRRSIHSFFQKQTQRHAPRYTDRHWQWLRSNFIDRIHLVGQLHYSTYRVQVLQKIRMLVFGLKAVPASEYDSSDSSISLRGRRPGRATIFHKEFYRGGAGKGADVMVVSAAASFASSDLNGDCDPEGEDVDPRTSFDRIGRIEVVSDAVWVDPKVEAGPQPGTSAKPGVIYSIAAETYVSPKVGSPARMVADPRVARVGSAASSWVTMTSTSMSGGDCEPEVEDVDSDTSDDKTIGIVVNRGSASSADSARRSYSPCYSVRSLESRRPSRSSRQNALLVAVSRQNSQSVLLQLRHDPKTLDLRSDFGAELLRIATDNGDLRTLRLLYDAGADVNIPFNDETAIFGAVRSGNMDVVRELVQRMRADVRVRNRAGRTLVMIAARERKADVLKLLLESHFKRDRRFIRLKENTYYGEGWQAIHFAAAGGSVRCFDLLFKHLGDGSDLVVEELLGETPLDIAYKMNKGEAMFEIVSHIGRALWDTVGNSHSLAPEFVGKVCELSGALVQKATLDLENILLPGQRVNRLRGSGRGGRMEVTNNARNEEADVRETLPKLKLLGSFLNGNIGELPLLPHTHMAQKNKPKTFRIGHFGKPSTKPIESLHFQTIRKQWAQYRYELVLLLLAFRYRFSMAAKAERVKLCKNLLRQTTEADARYFVRLTNPYSAAGSRGAQLPDPLPPSSSHPDATESSNPALKPKLLISLHCNDQTDVATLWIDEGWKEPNAPVYTTSKSSIDSTSTPTTQPPITNPDPSAMDLAPQLHLIDPLTLHAPPPHLAPDRTTKLDLTPLEFAIKFACKRMFLSFLAGLGSVDKLAPAHIHRPSSQTPRSNLNQLPFYYRMTPLNIALRHEQADIVYLLVSDLGADFLRENAPYQDFENLNPNRHSHGLIFAAPNRPSNIDAVPKGKGKTLSEAAKTYLQSSRAKPEDFERILEAHVEYKRRRIAEIRAQVGIDLDSLPEHVDEEYEFYNLEPDHFGNSILQSSWYQHFNAESPDPAVEPESSHAGERSV